MVDVKLHISWKVNLQTAYTYDEDLVSLKGSGAGSYCSLASNSGVIILFAHPEGHTFEAKLLIT